MSTTEHTRRTISPAHTRTWVYGTYPWIPERDRTGAPRARVVVDNDFAGDPDDLTQLAHHLLCPAVDVRGVVVSRLREDDAWNRSESSVATGHERVDRLMATMGVMGVRVVDGDDRGFAAHPEPTAGSRLIVEEALREDDRPLFVAAGGSLGDVARALRAEPAIAQRLVLVWIGGAEHGDLAHIPAGATDMEYNMALDAEAARYVFNETQARLWQVPRDAYRRCAVSFSTLRRRLGQAGATGALLLDALAGVRSMLASSGFDPGQTYVLGDQPLVLLTALTTTFEPDTAGSDYVVRPTPAVAEDGTYRARPEARTMRVYIRPDDALMFDDMFDSLAELAAWQESPEA